VLGNALVRGYINNPRLTRERFLPDPSNPGWQYFKTGDLGKLLPDGQLVHLGRIDNMVKIKGVRIELDSIENHMLAYPGIVQVASRAIEDQKGGKRLASYFVPEKGIRIPVSDLRRHLAEHLPRHLVPHYLVPLDDMPLTGNGKVARTRLPLPQLVRPELDNPFVPPSDDLERQLVEIWEEEIGISGIGVTDDFFDVGGDSLIGVLVFVHIEKTLGRSLPVSALLTAATIRRQAGLIRSHVAARVISPLIPVNRGGQRPPLFFIPGKGGNPTRIRQLAKLLDSQTPVYGLQESTKLQQDQVRRSIESIASFYLDEIRKVYPSGPYILVGESMGGKIAYEMGVQMLKLGLAPPVLAMLDTYNLPKSSNRRHRASYYKMLLKKHATILWKSNWKGRLDYLRFYAGLGLQKMKALADRRRRDLGPADSSALPDRLRKMEERNRKIAGAYEVPPYPGRVILFKALRGPNAEVPSNGWDRVKLGGLVIHPLDCYHGSILFEPAISQLAGIIQSYIDQLE
jgi:thioesterase domain-containing protein